MTLTRALLLDLDDTLYDYVPAEQRGRDALLHAIASDLGMGYSEALQRYEAARRLVKTRLGARGGSHSRLLYLHELAHASGRPEALARVRSWERTFWGEYIAHARLRSGARPLLSGWRALGHKTAIVTDLVAEVQLWKLEAFGLFELIDAMVVSEEVDFDKPAKQVFELAMQRLGVTPAQCIVVGDSERKDGDGARALGLPFIRVRGSEPGHDQGLTLTEVAQQLGVAT